MHGGPSGWNSVKTKINTINFVEDYKKSISSFLETHRAVLLIKAHILYKF